MRRLISRIAFQYLFVFICALILTMDLDSIAQEWSPPVRIADTGYGPDPPQMIAVGDSLHVVFSLDWYYTKSYYIRSIDGGRSWSEPQLISDTACNAHPPKILHWQNRLMAIWENYNRQDRRKYLAYCISTDGGANWSPPIYAPDSSWLGGFSLAASNYGPIVNLTYFRNQDEAGFCIYNVRSTDFGETWSAANPIYNPCDMIGESEQVSFGSYVHFVWDGRFNDMDNFNLQYGRSTDAGLTWEDNIPLYDSSEQWQHMPAIAANHLGHLVVNWIMWFGDVGVRRSQDCGASWEPPIYLQTGHTPFFSNDVAYSGNTILVAWNILQHNGAGGVMFNKSYDGGYSWEGEYWIDHDSGMSEDPALAASKGVFYIIWFEWAEPRHLPAGLYFSRWPDWPDAIGDESADNFPQNVSLSAYPNPFNSSTIISYRFGSVSSIDIYDVEGRLVRDLVTDTEKGDIIWDAKDEKGRGLSSGIYFARAVGAGESHSAYLKLIYIK